MALLLNVRISFKLWIDTSENDCENVQKLKLNSSMAIYVTRIRLVLKYACEVFCFNLQENHQKVRVEKKAMRNIDVTV